MGLFECAESRWEKRSEKFSTAWKAFQFDLKPPNVQCLLLWSYEIFCQHKSDLSLKPLRVSRERFTLTLKDLIFEKLARIDFTISKQATPF